MARQHTHSSNPFSSKLNPIIIISDGLQSPANIGGLFRIAEAFGVAEIVFCNAAVDLDSNRLKRTARDSQHRVAYKTSEDILAEIASCKNGGYHVIGLEITDSSKPIQGAITDGNDKIVLVIGNERRGISQAALEVLDSCVHIEMFGENSSMNVIQATAIALYTFVNK